MSLILPTTLAEFSTKCVIILRIALSSGTRPHSKLYIGALTSARGPSISEVGAIHTERWPLGPHKLVANLITECNDNVSKLDKIPNNTL